VPRLMIGVTGASREHEEYRGWALEMAQHGIDSYWFSGYYLEDVKSSIADIPGKSVAI